MAVESGWIQHGLKIACASPGMAVITVRCGFFHTAAQCACLEYLHACIAKNGNLLDLGGP